MWCPQRANYYLLRVRRVLSPVVNDRKRGGVHDGKAGSTAGQLKRIEAGGSRLDAERSVLGMPNDQANGAKGSAAAELAYIPAGSSPFI